ncbi:ComEC/Rec2 family competence protein [Clostridium cellulovorans]|uniref:Beta-lactamase domain protein n=1 Tax=Clostridium cellulovorans (strain ATCC 35296 / DSM 3052 / OCM 3 / 743B) TaxID=573061 RepID=D9SW97_CLOC7|nr:MBL fold metallo-hydrolase [Clostridium cellulovorans]ADL51241.1 beta-lactamase domain protein [Clostridium cellulovorans 743B]
MLNKKIKRNHLITSLIVMTLLVVGVGCSPTNQNSNINNKGSETTTEDSQKDIAKENGQVNENATSPSEDNNEETKENSAVTANVTGDLKVHYINVGKADSIFIQQGNNSMLIDAGTNDQKKTVKNYLDTQGITKLDYVVCTHPHKDHVGGMDYIINNFQVDKVYMPNVTTTTETFQDVLVAMEKKGLKSIAPTVGETFNLGDAKCTILAPNSESYEDINDYSIVMKLQFGNTSFMFDGDAQKLSEKEIIAKGFDVKADVLKIGHHGSDSASSKTYLDAVKPKYAVISVGPEVGRYLPDDETIAKLKEREIQIFRTDKCGTIVATSDGNNISFNTKPWQ